MKAVVAVNNLLPGIRAISQTQPDFSILSFHCVLHHGYRIFNFIQELGKMMVGNLRFIQVKTAQLQRFTSPIPPLPRNSKMTNLSSKTVPGVNVLLVLDTIALPLLPSWILRVNVK